MRNLKKILALVLALVMSLSLMATAGAADFTDASSINEKYETAIEVLEGLGVFKGYQDGTFQPTGSITRAETAAIIYRIVTGDVKDEQVGIYADYGLFSDVPSTSWFAGYVNYCANAEYIKGVGGGKFEPNSQVTGYAALAMILRAIGYTANGGFTGPDWEVQTARTAEARKITKNILTGTLGQPATRETVAEILFQAILVNMVGHNVDHTFDGDQGYYELDESLGYKTFKLEQIQGVVTGNEFADLKSTQVLDEGETQLETEDGVRDLAITTEITDIGESRYAYITGTKVLAMGDTGLNKVTEFGNACEIDSTTKFNAAAEMPAASDIEYYVNFGRVGTYDCDQRLEFNVTFYGPRAESSFDAYANTDISWVAAHDSDWTVTAGTDTDTDGDIDNDDTWAPVALAGNDDYDDVIVYTGANAYRFTKIIRANDDITQTDLDILRGIFGAADNVNNNLQPQDRITGDVFVGTMSTNTTTNEERDLSNTISYNKFFTDYINPIDYNQNWNSSDNGEWVKFIDNDADGKADYAFRTDSWLDEAVDTYTNKDGDTVTAFASGFTDDDTDVPNGAAKVRYMDGEAPAVGTKVICSFIDNQYLVEPANDENVTVTDYNWRTDIINTDKGEYGQSGIDGVGILDLQYFINTMDMKTEYVVYFDHFGYVRAYELPGGTTYALVTEIYARNNANGNIVRDWPMNVELTVKDADTTEYGLNGGSNNLFVSNVPWTQVSNYASVGNYYNWLKPAVAHLGVPAATGWGPTVAADVDLGASYTFWTRNRQVAYDVDSMTKNDTFDYGPVNGRPTSAVGEKADWVNTASTSFTNVAVVNINGETASLDGAAKLRLDSFGNVMRWDSNGSGVVGDAGDLARYTVDYVQLTTANTVAGQTRYPIDTVNYTGWCGNAANNYVSATHDTEYYIVYNGGVYYFTDYTKMPKLTMDDNNIHAAYAVARDTSADNANEPYWVADVIVYEVENWIDTSKTSTALVYYNPSRNDAQIQRLNVLDSANGKVDAIPADYGWNSNLGYFNNFADYEGLGFYQFWDGEMQENGDLAVGDIVYIDGTNVGGVDLRFNSNLIYAGTVVNEVDVATRGTYLNVDTDGDGNTNVSLLVKPSAESNVYSVTTDYEVTSRWNYNEATALRYNNILTSEIKAGDRIVWIGTSAINPVSSNNTQSASFVVDLGNGINNNSIYSRTAAFLGIHPTPTSAVPDPDPAVLSGINPLWLQIMTEQKATKTKNNITIGAVELPDGSAGDNDVLGITVTPGPINLDVTTQAITFGNLGAYEIDDVTVINVIDGDPAAVAAIEGATWKLFNIKGDVQLKITLKDGVPTEGHTITVKYVGITAGTPTGVTVPADKTFTVADGADWLVKSTEIIEVVRGYTFSKVTDNGTGTSTTADLSPVLGGNYGIANVTADQTIGVVYTAGTYTLNVNTSNGTTNGLTGVAKIDYSVTPVGGTATAAAEFTPLNTAVGTGNTWAGASYSLTFTGNPLYTYSVSATNGTAAITNEDNAYTVSGVINGATTVTITETQGDATSVTVIAGGTTVTGLSNGLVVAGEVKQFTVAPSDTDHAVNSVSYQISGSAAVTYTAADTDVVSVAANGTWTVTLPAAAFPAGGTTTVTATEISTQARELTFTVTYTGNGLVYSLNGGTDTSITNGGKVNVKPGDVLVIKGNGAMAVTETGGAWTPAATITPEAGNLRVTVTIPAITGAVGLTIANNP